ncbi:MAG: hypothetical protein ACLVL7_06210, partial [Anaerotruncus massiliensis (ex Togo et al. 2019)]
MIRLTVSFVLRLLDDFTGSASDGGHLFWVDGRAARPQRKPGGYFSVSPVLLSSTRSESFV